MRTYAKSKKSNVSLSPPAASRLVEDDWCTEIRFRPDNYWDQPDKNVLAQFTERYVA